MGALTLHAYKVLDDGSIIRDTRVVVVDAPRDVTTDIQSSPSQGEGRVGVYRPGDTARLSFRTRAASGPVQTALGVAIVDESVFAVMEQDPGFAKLYFLLQKELLEPKYQIKGWTIPEILTPTLDVQLRATQDNAARAAWASLQPGALPMNVNSRPIKVEAAAQQRATGLNQIANGLTAGMILIPLGIWITVILAQAQNVRLQVKPEAWFELQDAAEKTLSIAANDIEVVYFRIKVMQFGEQAFQVTAWGDKMSDAIKRSVSVVPDGRFYRRSTSDWLRQGALVTATVPVESIGGTTRIEVKIYPGAVSQVVEGLEKILRLPYG